MKNYFLLIIISTFLFTSCKKEAQAGPSCIEGHLKYFGFTLVDVGWDDPLDSITKTNYVDEVAAFSNVADILVVNPTDNIIARMQMMSNNQMKAILHVNEIFFKYVGPGGPSGALYDLRSDYQARWNDFVSTNNLTNNHSMLQAFYIGEEPTWNSISYLELKAATDYMKATIPEVPNLVIEAYPILNNLQVPTSVDWIGFDHYFIKDPKNSSVFLNELATLKSKRSSQTQKIALVLDAHFISSLHLDYGGITEMQMKDVATSYYNLAQSDQDVVALLGYFWPGGFDDPGAKGARELPQNAKDEYMRIGKIISGK
ncbi:MAG: hypothetical protein H0U95_04235 [Bacteroidetes bacterium]|nr:hypothetical protein [Bacteroidota bacterium]